MRRLTLVVVFALTLLVSPSDSAQEPVPQVPVPPVPISKEKLQTEVERLINSTEGSTDSEVLAALGVLHTLKGTLLTGRTQQLFGDAVAPFAWQERERTKPRKRTYPRGTTDNHI